jgi:anaerobic magnesium-protoporphyrin IX monomethyl ester cyclase
MIDSADLLLINPITRRHVPAFIPNGLLWVASVVREKGFSVRVIDRNCDDADVAEILRTVRPKVVGLSVLTGGVILDAIVQAKLVREVLPGAIIVWGGLHPTLFPEAVLVEPYVDHIVMGEGEVPMAELMDNLLRGRGRIEEILNVGTKINGQIRLNPLRPFVDMDALPYPAFDLIDMSRYYLLRPYAKKTVCLMTSRGCPYNCAFCYNKKANRSTWRGMSASRLIGLIRHIQKRVSVDGFLFHDDNFDADGRRLKEFCELLIQKKMHIRWEHCSRVNYASFERLAMEKKAGCEMIAYGLESGSERILKLIHKGQTVAQIENAIRLCKKAGISTGVGSIIGYPFETEADLDETLKLFERARPTHIFTTIYNPYPGSDLYDHVIREGLFKEPATLQGQGEIYNIENLDLNMSPISNETLRRVMVKYSTYNLIHEVLDYLRFFNIAGLMVATFNYFKRPGAASRLWGRACDIVHKRRRSCRSHRG